MLPKSKICGLAFVLCLCMLCTGSARAGASKDIQDQIRQAEEKIHSLENSLNETDQDIGAYEQQQEALEQDISTGQEKISQLSTELDVTKQAVANMQTKIEKTQAELEQSKEDSREQYASMKQRIRFMYENSLTSMLAYILESGSIAETLRRANYFQSVVSYDREKLDEYKATTKKISNKKKQLVVEEEELESLEHKQEVQLSEIDGEVQALKEKLGDKISQIRQSKALREKYENEIARQKEYEAELERQKAEEDRKRAEEIRRQEEELERQRKERERRLMQEEQSRQEREAASRQSDTGQQADTDVWYEKSGSAEGKSDLDLMAAIIYCEAGNQPYKGKLAVGSVIMNRVASGSFPNSVSGVIYQSGQFSPVASGRFASVLASGLGNRCKSVAQEVLNGKRNVPFLYFRVNNGLIDGTVIGDHVFY